MIIKHFSTLKLPINLQTGTNPGEIELMQTDFSKLLTHFNPQSSITVKQSEHNPDATFILLS
jgi:hypothetical protein